MITLERIASEFERFLHAEISLQDFEGWLALESLDMHLQNVSEEVQEVVWSLELNFAEYTSGHLSRYELINEAKELLSFPLQKQDPLFPPFWDTKTDNSISLSTIFIRFTPQIPIEPDDRPLRSEFLSPKPDSTLRLTSKCLAPGLQSLLLTR